MMHRLLLSLLLIFNTPCCFGQPASALLSSASQALTQLDTNAAIGYLEDFAQKYPSSAAIYITNQRLAEMYISRKNYDSARAKLLYAVSFKSSHDANTYREIFDSLDNLGSFAKNYFTDIGNYLLLSRVFELQNNNRKALQYLNLADTICHKKHGDCGNDLINCESYVSLSFADHYIRTGDTVKAISRLVQYFLAGEHYSYEAAKKLKQVLHYKYSIKEIKQEIDRGIASSIVRDGGKNEPRKVFCFTIFGCTICKNATHTDREAWIKILKQSDYLVAQLIQP